MIQPVGGTLVREYPLLTTRFAVAGLGLVALVIALRPGTIHDLIMTAASFGSAGLVVVTLFGLFTRIGGAASAAVALLLGAAVRSGASFFAVTDTPYICGVASAVLGYLAEAISRR